MPTNRPHLTLYEASSAAKARLDGQFDNPALVKFGPLAGRLDDVREILGCCPEALPRPLSSSIPDDRNDTVDALVQAEAFISGFEGDELQEGIPDILAGVRAAIEREQARPNHKALIDDLWNFIENAPESGPERQEQFFELRGRVHETTW